jgi:hypothetical protein
MAKSNKINLVDITDLPLEHQLHQIFIGKGLRSTYGNSLNLIELAEEMVEIERRQEILVEILRDIASEHPEVRDKVMKRLSDIAKDNEVLTIVHDIQ